MPPREYDELWEEALAQKYDELWEEASAQKRLEASAPGRRLAVGATQKYVEVLAINDYPFCTSAGSAGSAAATTAAILNIVTTMFREPTGSSTSWTAGVELQVVLVGQHSFTNADPWESLVISTANAATIASGDVDSSSLLDKFNSWVEAAEQTGAVPPHDNHVLLSGRDFEENTLGLAFLNTICGGQRSGSVNMVGSYTNAQVAATVAHEMGHNFGLTHDGLSDKNQCPSSGKIMAAEGSGDASEFSSCSLAEMEATLSSTWYDARQCLENTPSTVYGDPSCGNGLREDGEDCDDPDGVDPCCDASTCKFAIVDGVLAE